MGDSRRLTRGTDHVAGRHQLARAHFHVHPQIAAEMASARQGRFVLPDGRAVIFRIAKGVARLENATYHPQFGVTIPSLRLAVTLERGESEVAFDVQ